MELLASYLAESLSLLISKDVDVSLINSAATPPKREYEATVAGKIQNMTVVEGWQGPY
jgi:hypothetical protein